MQSVGWICCILSNPGIARGRSGALKLAKAPRIAEQHDGTNNMTGVNKGAYTRCDLVQSNRQLKYAECAETSSFSQ